MSKIVKNENLYKQYGEEHNDAIYTDRVTGYDSKLNILFAGEHIVQHDMLSTIWIKDPSIMDVQYLETMLNLSAHTLESILSTRENVENHETYTYVSLKYSNSDLFTKFLVHPLVTVILGGMHDHRFVEELKRQRWFCGTESPFAPVLLAMKHELGEISDYSDGCIKNLERIEGIIMEEQKSNKSSHNHLLREIIDLQSRSLRVRANTRSKLLIVQKLRAYKRYDALESLRYEFRDLALRMDEHCERLMRCYSNYLVLSSSELTRKSNELSTTMKRTSSMTLLLLPAQIVIGLWGMNVKVPWQCYGDDCTYTGFLCVSSGIFILIGFASIYAARKRWL